MQKISLDALAREHLKRARSVPRGRSAQTVYGGHEHVLRQALMTLVKGRSLAEHENPGEATVLVLRGPVQITAGAGVWQAREGDLLIVPGARHPRGGRGLRRAAQGRESQRADTGLTSRQRGCRLLAGHAHDPSSWPAGSEELTARRAPVRAQGRERRPSPTRTSRPSRR